MRGPVLPRVRALGGCLRSLAGSVRRVIIYLFPESIAPHGAPTRMCRDGHLETATNAGPFRYRPQWAGIRCSAGH